MLIYTKDGRKYSCYGSLIFRDDCTIEFYGYAPDDKELPLIKLDIYDIDKIEAM